MDVTDIALVSLFLCFVLIITIATGTHVETLVVAGIHLFFQ